MPKPDFRKVKEERSPWKTQEVVTPEQGYPDSAQADTVSPMSDDRQKEALTHARTHTRKSTAAQAQEKRSTIIEMLYRQLQTRKHLSSYTFRYRPEELDELEQIFTQIDAKSPGKLSRNDIARLALNALFEDYRSNGDASTLAQVLERM